MRRLFTCLLLLSTCYGFGWRDFNEVIQDQSIVLFNEKREKTFDFNTEEFVRISGANKEFGRIQKETKGVHLQAFNKNTFTIVKIRHQCDLANIIVHFNENVDEGAKLFMCLLDKDGFLVSQLYVDAISPNFKGNLYADLQISLDDLKRVKSYEFHYR